MTEWIKLLLSAEPCRRACRTSTIRAARVAMATINMSPAQTVIAKAAMRSFMQSRDLGSDLPRIAGCALVLSQNADMNERFLNFIGQEILPANEEGAIYINPFDNKQRAREKQAMELYLMIAEGLGIELERAETAQATTPGCEVGAHGIQPQVRRPSLTLRDPFADAHLVALMGLRSVQASRTHWDGSLDSPTHANRCRTGWNCACVP